MAKNWTAPQIAKHKVSDGNEPLVMLTAYDAPGGRMVSEAGADIILVGCLLYTSPSPRDGLLSRMPSSA